MMCMHIACWLPRATNTHLEYVILIAFPLQQVLHRRASLLRYLYTTCLVDHCIDIFCFLLFSDITIVFTLVQNPKLLVLLRKVQEHGVLTNVIANYRKALNWSSCVWDW
jgi:hypothetical protein